MQPWMIAIIVFTVVLVLVVAGIIVEYIRRSTLGDRTEGNRSTPADPPLIGSSNLIMMTGDGVATPSMVMLQQQQYSQAGSLGGSATGMASSASSLNLVQQKHKDQPQFAAQYSSINYQGQV